MEALKHFKKPKTKSDLRAFLGIIGYYHRFVPGFAQKAYPLTEATKNIAPNIIKWSIDMSEELKELCSILYIVTNLTYSLAAGCICFTYRCIWESNRNSSKHNKK